MGHTKQDSRRLLDSVLGYGLINEGMAVSVSAKERVLGFLRGTSSSSSSAKNGRGALATGGLAALLGTACCLAPLVLVSVGLGGAWLSNLRALQPYQPIFIGIAVVALVFAYMRIFRPAAECRPGDVCALPGTRRGYKMMFWIVVGLVVLTLGFPYAAPLFY